MNTNVNVAIYVRVSTMYQADKDSLPMQKSDLINFSKLILNTENYEIFEDAGYSGKNLDRPGFQKMISGIRAHKFTHLLVWKIDRISRNLLDFANLYNELKKLNVTFISKNEQFDTSTAIGEAMLKIILVFAELERKMTSERVSATMISRAQSGLWNGGSVPYGYMYDQQSKSFSINESEAEIIRTIFDDYEEHKSITRITNYLNDNLLLNRAGNKWQHSVIRYILYNEFYTGSYSFNKYSRSLKTANSKEKIILKENHHPMIISADQFSRVNEILNENKGLYSKKDAVSIFGRKLFCTSCGKIMYAHHFRSGSKRLTYTFYRCNKCQGKISDRITGEFVFNFILNMINARRFINSFTDIKGLQKSLLNSASFKDIRSIDSSSLQAIWDVLHSSKSSKNIFKVNVKPPNVSPKISELNIQREKLDRAITRLTDLYLNDDNPLSENEFISRRHELCDKLHDIDDELATLTSDSWESSITDDEFVKQASSLILSSKFNNKVYLNFYSLLCSTDHQIIKAFVDSTVHHINVSGGKIVSITFVNNLIVIFNYK